MHHYWQIWKVFGAKAKQSHRFKDGDGDVSINIKYTSGSPITESNPADTRINSGLNCNNNEWNNLLTTNKHK